MRAFSTLSTVCVGTSAGWPRFMHCCAFAADPRRLTPCRLRGIFEHRFRTSIGSSASSNCSNPGAHTPHLCSYGVCDLLRPAHPQWYPQERLSAAADPMNVMSSCRPILVTPCWAVTSDSGEGKLQSKHKHNLHSSGALPASPCRAFNGPEPSCRTVCHCAAPIAASCGQAPLVASGHVDRKALPQAFSRSIAAAQHRRAMPVWGMESWPLPST